MYYSYDYLYWLFAAVLAAAAGFLAARDCSALLSEDCVPIRLSIKASMRKHTDVDSMDTNVSVLSL